jgi:single-stranded-DNA-specific exonuclease
MRQRLVWQVYPGKQDLIQELSARHQVPPLVACLLLNRGLVEPEDILAFLEEPDLGKFPPPFGLPDLDKAAARLAQAVQRREKVVVYGDYDADGLTATCLLHGFLQELGLAGAWYIPNRLTQGYGLNQEALKELARHNQLLVTVDCGVSDGQEVGWAQEHGLEVIITDHHELPAELPPASAVVNPKRAREEYPFENLAGVGVALLLAMGVRRRLRESGWFDRHPEPNLRDYLDLVALGTAADVAPVLGENRLLIRQGLKVMENTSRPGFIALKETAGLEGKPISYRDLVFRLAPRLNAAGRLGQANMALTLLLETDRQQARLQAQYLNNLNRERQTLEEGILRQAEGMIKQTGLAGRPVLVLAGDWDPETGKGWHPGVLGIVAARLAEAYYRPVALVALRDGLGTGSARSIEGFHLFQGLRACRQLLNKFGGHEAAAGFRLAAANLPALQAGLEQAFADQIGAQRLRPTLKVDAQIDLSALDQEFFQHLERLRPFGPGNPEPVFVCREVEGRGSTIVGEEKRHLRLTLAQGNFSQQAIAFGQAAQHPLEGPLEVAFSARLSYFNGHLKPELRLLDWGRR